MIFFAFLDLQIGWPAFLLICPICSPFLSVHLLFSDKVQHHVVFS
jgi:hypothetical protein